MRYVLFHENHTICNCEKLFFLCYHILNVLQNLNHWLRSNSDGYVTSYGQISPIEISTEELEKFGFERFKKKISMVSSELIDYWEKSYGESDEMGIKPVFTIWTDRKVSYFSMKTLNKPSDRKFRYIHELQQLFKLHTENDLIYEDK